MCGQTYTQYSTPVTSNGTKNLLGSQSHGGIVANQGQSHRDSVKLPG